MADVNEDLPQGEDNVVDQTAVEDTTQGTQSSNEPQYTDTERQAMAQGWVPKDQFTGTGKWRDAEEFLDRGQLFAKIDEQSREIKATKNVLEEFKKHHRKVAEVEYQRALAQLRQEKKTALLDGDVDRVLAIDDQIDATKTEQTATIQQIERMQTTSVQDVPNPAFVAWVNRNQWYQNEKAMKAYADTLGAELAQQGMRNPTEILEEVERRTKKEFAHKFNNPNRSKPGAVDSGGTRTGGARADSFTLTAEETQVMNKLVRHGVMTKEEYIAEAKASRKV
jgi:hypothetical protein